MKIMDRIKKTRFNELGLFHKIFITLIAVIIIPTVLISFINYDISRKNLVAEVCKSNLDTLRQTKEALDNTLKSTERISVQLAANQITSDFLNKNLDISDIDHVDLIRSTVNLMETMLQGAQHIEKIGVYSLKSKLYLGSGTESYRYLNDRELKGMTDLALQRKEVYWLDPYDDNFLDGKSNSIQLIKVLYNYAGSPLGFVQIKLKNSEFGELIENLYIRKSGYITVLNQEGLSIVHGSNHEGAHKEDIVSKYGLSDSMPEGYKVWSEFQKKDILISYTTSNYTNWKYVAVLPSDEIQTKSDVIRNNIILICLIFAGASVLFSMGVTKGIYNPIALIEHILKGDIVNEEKLGRLQGRKDEIGRINQEIRNIISRLSSERIEKDNVVEENHSLKVLLDDNTSKLKDYFLYRLICGDINDKVEIAAQAEFLDISADTRYMVLVVEFDQSYKDEILSMDNEQQNIIKNGIISIFDNGLKNVVTPVKLFFESYEHNERMIGILSTAESEEPDYYTVKVVCNFIQNLIFSKFNFTVTIAGGLSHPGLENIRKSYDEALQALKYKFILGSSSILFRNEMDGRSVLKPRQYYYRSHLKNCLIKRDLPEINRLLSTMQEELKDNMGVNPSYIYSNCRDIINTLHEFLSESSYPYPGDYEELNDAFIHFENRFENMDKALEWMIQFIHRVFERTNDMAPSKYHKTIQEALKIIENGYNTDLSLTYMAEKLEVSETYFSKLFKEETGSNFKEYLTKYKIIKAKELLRVTKLPVQEIASRVGYNNHKQFIRIFKQYEGITAMEYRNSLHEEA